MVKEVNRRDVPIRVAVNGAQGRVGREVLAALCHDAQFKPVGAVEVRAKEPFLPLPDGSGNIPFSTDLDLVLQTTRPDVLVDFTIAEASMAAVRVATQHRVHLVIGTTGFTADNLVEIDELAKASGVGAVVAPNFALGAVVMIHLAKIAARFFDYAEIIEMHHEQKADAPSGTALSTARAMLESRGKPFLYPVAQKQTLSHTRGGELGGIGIHSMRMPGLSAHQEIVLGALGQTLTIRHDAISRECYMPGLLLAVRKVVGLKGLTYGLDTLLGL